MVKVERVVSTFQHAPRHGSDPQASLLDVVDRHCGRHFHFRLSSPKAIRFLPACADVGHVKARPSATARERPCVLHDDDLPRWRMFPD